MPPTFTSNAEQRAKKAEDYPSIFGAVNLTSIRENVGEILKLVGRDGIFREYTLHDSNHIDELLHLVDKLIPAETASKMKTADWLLIVLSCYFHDLGMLVTKQEFENSSRCDEFLAFKSDLLAGDKGKDYEEALGKLTEKERDEFFYQEFVRTNHAKRVFHWIKGQEAPQYGDAKATVEAVNGLLCGLEQVFRDDLAKVCLSHHEDDLFDLDKYQVNRAYGDGPEGEANIHYAALLLRAADVLQIQRKRVPPVLYKLIDPSNPKSQEEWVKQMGVRAVKPKKPTDGTPSDTIEVHASFEKETAYFGLLAYLQQFAGKELERCHDWAKLAEKRGSTFRFPWKQIDSSQVEPRGFEGRSYRFTLDQEKILKLLTGHTLYNDSRVAVREVLQNALDAVRFRKHLFPAEPMGKIEVIWDTKARKLTIRDTGTGMTQETVEKFLLNVGSSYYQSEAVVQQHSGFSAISRFGIGVLSTFMIADEVQILTVHPDDDYARRLTLPSVVKSYLIKKISKGDTALRAIGQHGTEVVLQIRRSAELQDVEALVRYWLIIPGCQVTCTTDDREPVSIGFGSAKAVLEYYHAQARRSNGWKVSAEVREITEQGIQLAYAVQKWTFTKVWDFCQRQAREERRFEELTSAAPGMCVEGVRVRSQSAGYEPDSNAPWVFANMTGRDAPRTNVARSDVEQTPELERALLRTYSMLGRHVQGEFSRMLGSKAGIVEAAFEADYMVSSLEDKRLTNRKLFNEAMASLKVVALEKDGTCIAFTKTDLDTLGAVWTVDGRLVRDLEGVSGALGIDLSAEKIVEALGRSVKPPIPGPRLLGTSRRPLRGREIGSIEIRPEDRSYRIDIRWEKVSSGRWVTLNRETRSAITDVPGPYPRRNYDIIQVTADDQVFAGCAGYDVVIWRNCCFIRGKSGIGDLLDVFGMTREFGHWLGKLLHEGEICEEDRPLLRERLRTAKGSQSEELLKRLALPFDRRFGDYANFSRDSDGSPWEL